MTGYKLVGYWVFFAQDFKGHVALKCKSAETCNITLRPCFSFPLLRLTIYRGKLWDLMSWAFIFFNVNVAAAIFGFGALWIIEASRWAAFTAKIPWLRATVSCLGTVLIALLAALLRAEKAESTAVWVLIYVKRFRLLLDMAALISATLIKITLHLIIFFCRLHSGLGWDGMPLAEALPIQVVVEVGYQTLWRTSLCASLDNLCTTILVSRAFLQTTGSCFHH